MTDRIGTEIASYRIESLIARGGAQPSPALGVVHFSRLESGALISNSWDVPSLSRQRR
jgi:hypothetical protein